MWPRSCNTAAANYRNGVLGLSHTNKITSSKRLNLTGRMSSSKTPPALSSVKITFLGTASAQPSSTRNHSALALHLGGDVWLFDCGEATQHRIQRSSVKMGKIQKVFITHTHGASHSIIYSIKH